MGNAEPPAQTPPARYGRLIGAIRWLPQGLRSAGAQRARWGIIDQGFSSVTNFTVTAVVAHQVAPAEFGSFSVALAIYICLLWVARSMVGEPFVVRLTNLDATAQVAGARDALGAAFVVGCLTGAATAAAGMLIGSTSGAILVATGLFLPGLLAQDAYRYVLMASGRARAAAANDGLWLAVQGVLTAALLVAGHPGAVGLTVVFGSAATVGAFFGAWQTGAIPSMAGWRRWLRRHQDLWAPFVLELLTVNATPNLSMLVVAATGGVVLVGGLRAGMFLFAPLTVLFSGLYLVGLPEAVRLRQRSPSHLWALVVGLAVMMAVLTFVWAGALWLVPGHLGAAVLKANWSPGRRLLAPMAAFTAATSCILAGIVGLRALEVARQSIRARIWAGPVVVASGIIGARVAGAAGAATGLALASWFSVALTWAVLRRAMAHEQAARRPGAYGAAPPMEARPAETSGLADTGNRAAGTVGAAATGGPNTTGSPGDAGGPATGAAWAGAGGGAG